ncbi:MAG TPA: DUF2066 domain-containing protein [Woeseiaceae bacterium]|nr:DUF2066 domain-containing protein [Woeseiaceae bacterium]
MKNTLQKACTFRRYSLILLGLMSLVAALPAAAIEVDSLYTAKATLERDDAAHRAAAYTDALSQVLSRITGLSDPLQAPEIAPLFPDPSRYVLQYRPGEDRSLWVTFDGAALERALRSANVTVWSNDRPLTLVWLAVDWGQGEREIIAAGNGEEEDLPGPLARDRLLRERVQEAATRRGIPIAFPLLDVEDLQIVSFSDVWGGFDDRLLLASRRYGANSVLVGRIRPDARNRWSWYFGNERRAWTGEPEAVIEMLANTLASQFAIAGNEQLDTFDLTISGIDSVAAYGAVQSYMENLDVVDALAIDRVTGDSVRYRVSAHGGAERLQRVLEFSGVLEPVNRFGRPGAVPGPAALEFRYRP